MNKYMHPRNIYKKRPDFKQLAIEYPEFRAIAKTELTGNVTIDFQDSNALRILTKCLLMKDFGLDVYLPIEKLIPTLTLRLNYILFIEDIINTFNILNVHGIDIGCGASCIYPLLAAKLYKWKMIALEICSDSISIAEQNVERNELTEYIQIVHQEQNENNDNKILSICSNNDQFKGDKINFLMCNPPFFDTIDELKSAHNNRTGKRPKPKNAQTGTANELVFSGGGEYAFIKQIIRESFDAIGKIDIFTTMIGHKHNVIRLLNYLREHSITNYMTTEFCQGQTTRWAIAWTHSERYLLRKVPTYGIGNISKTPMYTNKFKLIDKIDITHLYSTLEHLFENHLDFNIQNFIKHSNTKITCDVYALKNTWSKQRQRRRELKKIDGKEEQSEHVTLVTDKDDETVVKQMKFNDENGTQPPSTTTTILVFGLMLQLYEHDSYYELNLEYYNGLAGKDAVHQILQYIINHFKN